MSAQISGRSVSCARWEHAEIRSVFAALSADILRFLNKSPENQAVGDTFKSRLGALLTPQLLCLVIYRFAHYFQVNGWSRLAVALTRWNMFVHKLNLPADSCIGPGCFLPHPAAVTFYGTAGRGLTIYSQAVSVPEVGQGTCALIGDGVTLGAHASLVGPVQIGDFTKIGYAVPVRANVPGGVTVICPEVFGLHGSRRATKREAYV
jgi:serine O-acetyltransferase